VRKKSKSKSKSKSKAIWKKNLAKLQKETSLSIQSPPTVNKSKSYFPTGSTEKVIIVIVILI
jgi:hypothetical protein